MEEKMQKKIALKYESIEEDMKYIIEAQIEALGNLRLIRELGYLIEKTTKM